MWNLAAKPAIIEIAAMRGRATYVPTTSQMIIQQDIGTMTNLKKRRNNSCLNSIRNKKKKS